MTKLHPHTHCASSYLSEPWLICVMDLYVWIFAIVKDLYANFEYCSDVTVEFILMNVSC